MRVGATLGLALLCAGSIAVAQFQLRTISARAGTIGYQQGSVYVDDKRVHSTSGKPPFQMKNGERLHVDSGRVEVLLGPGVYLRMLGFSSIQMQETQLADTRVLMEDGSALIEVTGMNKGAQLRIICGESVIELKRDGLYRFDAPHEAAMGRLRIYNGEAAVEREGAIMRAKSGQAVDFGPVLEPAKFDSKQIDALHSWSAQRIKRRTDNEQRRVQARMMRAAKSKVEMEERNDAAVPNRLVGQGANGPQP